MLRRPMRTVAAVAALAAAPPAAADPGPDALRAPQLENTGIWRAAPILVSGATAYREGEFVYQDFLFDDHGANTGRRDGADPRSGPYESPGGLPGGDLFSPPNGTYTYPSDPVYATTPLTSSSCASARWTMRRPPRDAELDEGPRRRRDDAAARR